MFNYGYPPVNYTIGNGYPGVQPNPAQSQPQTRGTAGYTGNVPPQVMSGAQITPQGKVVSMPPQFEQSYVENILRLNLGKPATFYMTYENNSQWNAKVFTGILEAAGRDHIIISERQTGRRIILLMVNLDYVVFDEPLTYQYPGVIGNPPQAR